LSQEGRTALRGKAAGDPVPQQRKHRPAAVVRPDEFLLYLSDHGLKQAIARAEKTKQPRQDRCEVDPVTAEA
jgi:hypothetical protein